MTFALFDICWWRWWHFMCSRSVAVLLYFYDSYSYYIHVWHRKVYAKTERQIYPPITNWGVVKKCTQSSTSNELQNVTITAIWSARWITQPFVHVWFCDDLLWFTIFFCSLEARAICGLLSVACKYDANLTPLINDIIGDISYWKVFAAHICATVLISS